MNYCTYYQAEIDRSRTWLFVALIRSYEHLAFDRTVNQETSTFEFYVPPMQASRFEAIMQELIADGLVHNLRQLPNRLKDSQAIL